MGDEKKKGRKEEIEARNRQISECKGPILEERGHSSPV